MEHFFVSFDKALDLLKHNHVVAVPTETVYGLAGNAYCSTTLEEIYRLKKRPHHNPLIVHYESSESMKRDILLCLKGQEIFEALGAAFWPGPLTLVVPKNPHSSLRSFPDSLGVRCPAHPLMRDLLKNLPFPLGAPSANPSGYLSPTRAHHVTQHLSGVPVLDGGPCHHGLESTIIDLRHPEHPHLLRLGAIPFRDISSFLWEKFSIALKVLKPSSEECQGSSQKNSPKIFLRSSEEFESHSFSKPSEKTLLCPGLLLRHYEPRKPMRLLKGPTKSLPGEGLLSFGQPYEGFSCVFSLSDQGCLKEMAHRLFQGLHELDNNPSCTCLAVMPFPSEGLGATLLERLQRGAYGYDTKNQINS